MSQPQATTQSNRPLFEALRCLPAPAQDEVWARLADAAEEYERTHDTAPFGRLLESLLVTARLHRNPRYLKSLAEANAPGATEGAVDMRDYLQRSRDRRNG